MKTDMENAEQGGFSGSSRTPRRQGKSDKSQQNSRTNSRPAPAEDDGNAAETKLTSLDVLLTMLQSLLGEIKDCGGDVRMAEWSDGLSIQLLSAAYCRTHRMMHSGPTCPMC